MKPGMLHGVKIRASTRGQFSGDADMFLPQTLAPPEGHADFHTCAHAARFIAAPEANSQTLPAS